MQRKSSFSKYLLLLAVLAFIFVGFLGPGHTDMTMGSDGQMSSGNCFMPGMTAALCPMNPLEHIAMWQSMFTAVPSQNDILLLLALLLALALGALYIARRSTAPPEMSTSPSQQAFFVYYKRHILIISPLQEAFSNGTLHPKIF